MYMTRGINEKIANDPNFSTFILNSIQKFSSKDWGNICDEDKQLNDWALKYKEGRIVARYNHINEVDNIYIIASFFNGKTQIEILFCDEY